MPNIHTDTRINGVSLPQNWRLLKLISRQLSWRESIYRWLCIARGLPLAPRRHFSACHYHTHSSVARTISRMYVHAGISARGSIATTSKCLVYAISQEVQEHVPPGRERELDTRDNRHFANRATISSFVLMRLKRSFRSASYATRRARLDRDLTTRRAS